MSNNMIPLIVVLVELVLRGACVYAIIRVTATLFRIKKDEALEKERDAALTWVPKVCATCQHCTETCCPPCVDGTCWRWQYGSRKREEVVTDDDNRTR